MKQTKIPKLSTSIRLTPLAKVFLKKLSNSLGISQSSILEVLIREKAKKEGIK
jgi:hypothetical protein